MDKRKIHCEKVSPAYFHEQSRLRKRLDEYQREKDKCLRKISNRQGTLASATQQGIGQSVEGYPRRRPNSTFTTLNSENPENMELYRTQLEFRKLSIGSDTRHRKLSGSSEMKNKKKTIRQLSDPLASSSQTSFKSRVIALPRRKLTTGQIDVAVSSKEICPNFCDILKTDLSRNQSTTRTRTVLSTESEHEHSKINFATRLSSVQDTQLRMFNKTSGEEQSKHIKDSVKNAPKKLLYQRPKTSNDNIPSFQGLPSVLSEKTKTANTKAENYFHKITPGTSVIKNGQFENTAAEKVTTSGESSSGNETPNSTYCDSELNLNLGSENEAEKSNNNVFRKSSLSAADIRKRHLHEQTGARLASGASEGVSGFLGNAWSENNSARRKISTVEAPKGISEHSSSSDKQNDYGSSSSRERERHFEALRNFRRLALVAVTAERFSAKNLKSSSENREIIVPKRKLSSKGRLEELQRPTESYLRQIVAGGSCSKTPTTTRSVSAVNAGKTSGITKFRRVSQAAMATRILIARENRKVTSTGSGFTSLESRKETNQEKSLAEMMNELKNCRYLRTDSTFEHE